MNKKTVRLIQPSTVNFIREARKISDYSLFDLIHGYIYARWIYLYIGIGTGEHWIAKRLISITSKIKAIYNLFISKPLNHNNLETPLKGSEGITFADTYHGKVVPLENATRLLTIKEDIALPNLEQVLPYKRARDIILQNPEHIVLLDCPCRLSRENPCQPIDVCIVVGEPFASFAIEHQPDHARWITPEKAVEIVKEEDARGHVHHAFFKDAMLGRFYAICNCFSCCCGAIHAHQHGTPMLASSGFLAEIDKNLCISCGNCIEYCQFGALTTGELITQVDANLCMGCGVCVDKCDQGAISLQLDPSKGQPLEIQTLMAQVLEEA